MKLPSKVIVGPLKYSVSLGSNLRDDHGNECFAYTDHDSLKIKIDKHIHKDLASFMLMHEVLHTFLFQSGEMLEFDEEERLVKTLTPFLTSFLRDNQEIVRFIQDYEEI